MFGERRAPVFQGIAWVSETLADALVSVARRRAAPAEDHRCQALVLELFMFLCDPGHPSNHYACTGLPRTHAGWEMQLIVDDGLLYFVYAHCCAALHEARDELELRDAVARLCAALDCDDHELRERLRAYYAETIVEFIADRRHFEPRGRELLTAYFDCLVIQAYLRLAACAPGSTITFDLFPAHTGVDNVREGLKGLVNVGDLSHRGARKFYCCRAEIYTRYYGRNLARALGSPPGQPPPLRFGLVIPHANCVRHIALTRAWPIDGAENIARHVEQVHGIWAAAKTHAGRRERPPTILVSGYSQGGAAVRVFNDALAGVDVLGHPYFRASAPRWYGPRSRTLARIIAGGWSNPPELALHTVSIATMGGIDGRPLAELADGRGVAGVLSHANRHAGLHLGICHDHDPARWIVPGPLRPRPRARGIVQILMKFGGPAQVLHGGTWTRGAHQTFARNPSAMRLIDEVDRLRVSARFVDEQRYFDERCVGEAFTHLVVGTYGYPGWTVVETFARALAGLRERASAASAELAEPLLREPSWVYDILPEDADHAAVTGAARSIELAARRHLLDG